MKKELLLIYAATLLAMIFWGFSFIWSKMVFEVYKPITTVLLRLVLSSAMLWVIGLATRRLVPLRRKDIKPILLLTFYQPFLYFIGENVGLSMVSSTVAAVIISTIPLLTPIASFAYFGERVRAANLAGIGISVIGVFMVIIEPDFSLRANPWGIALLLLAVVSAIAYSVVIAKLTGRYNAYSITTYQNTLGILFFLPVFFITDFAHFRQAELTSQAFWALLQLAVFASSLAFIFFTYGIQKLGITKANAIANIIPVFTAIFAFFLLDERLTFINMTGVLVVVGGLFLSQSKMRIVPRRYRLPKY